MAEEEIRLPSAKNGKRPVLKHLIMNVPDKSRLDIPVDLEALSAFLHELTVILFADLEPWNSLSRLKGTFITL